MTTGEQNYDFNPDFIVSNFNWSLMPGKIRYDLASEVKGDGEYRFSKIDFEKTSIERLSEEIESKQYPNCFSEDDDTIKHEEFLNSLPKTKFITSRTSSSSHNSFPR